MADSRQLLLLRHGKSSWDEPGLADHERPLAPRGRRASRRMGRYLRREGIAVDLVLCSSARRARQTAELADLAGELRIESGLYAASAEQLLARLRTLPDAVRTAMLIGHNPALHDLAAGLAGEAGGLSDRKFPTAALATLRFTGPWTGLEWGGAALVSFVRPKDLS